MTMASSFEPLAPKPNSVHLQQRVTQIYDHLYANAAVRTPAGICAEVGKLLHTAMFMEEVQDQSPAFSFERGDLKALLSQEPFRAGQVAAAIRRSFKEMNAAWHLYESAAKILLSDLDIAYTAGQLTGIPISDRGRDVFGDTIEIIRSHWVKRAGGQYFTDHQVTSLAMTLLDFDPRRGDDLVDICAGTGGFLLAGINHIRKLLEAKPGRRGVESELVRLASRSIRGQEVDNGICDLANASLLARLNSAGLELVSRGDSLHPDAFRSKTGNGLAFGSHTCAASNPPFGTKITVKDPNVLKGYDLALAAPHGNAGLIEGWGKLTPRAPDILFLEQNIRMLSPGIGRLAIVLPYQILSGPQTFYVREWLLRHAKVMAVVDLPVETFQPHTGTKTALVVVRRREQPLDDLRDDAEGTVFMAMPRWIGHDRRGNPVYRKTSDGRTTDEILTDFTEVQKAFGAFLGGENPAASCQGCFGVDYRQIVQDTMLRINALFHRPVQQFGTHPRKPVSKGDASAWEYRRLGDVVKRIFFPTRFKRDYVDHFPEAVPFLGGANITELIPTSNKWLRPDDPKLESLKVEAGWILVTRSGSTGIVSSVPDDWHGYAMSEHVIRIVPDPEKLDPNYLLALLRTRYAQEQLSRGVFGSVIDEITPEFIADIELPIPRSRNLLASISQGIAESEQARQKAIENMVNAVGKLNTVLAG